MPQIVRRRPRHYNKRCSKLNCVYTDLPVGEKVVVIPMYPYKQMKKMWDKARKDLDRIKEIVK